MRRKLTAAVFFAILLVWAVPFASAADAETVLPGAGDTLIHESYLSGSPDGMFYPDRELSRAELAQLLSRLVGDRDIAGRYVDYADVADDDWYASAVRTVTSLGMMSGDNGCFYPDKPATRANCAAALVYFLPEGDVTYYNGGAAVFPDVPEDHWAYGAISRTAQFGLFRGDDNGAFLPENGLRRCEAATVINRLLGRTPDAETLASADSLQIFPDVPRSHWAYAEIMEASTSHSCVHTDNSGERWISVQSTGTIGLADGCYRINGALYCVQNGRFLYDTSYSVFTFDRDGRYTTGDAELDKQLNAIVEQYAAPVSGRTEKLRALYNYVRDNYSYLKQPLVSADQTDWEPGYASFFLSHGKGNCFNFAATYCLLCRELGEEAVSVIGLLGRSQSPHGWVMIKLDGVTYMFDPQLEWRYLHDYKRTGYDLFMMRPNNARFRYTWLSVQPD